MINSLRLALLAVLLLAACAWLPEAMVYAQEVDEIEATFQRPSVVEEKRLREQLEQPVPAGLSQRELDRAFSRNGGR